MAYEFDPTSDKPQDLFALWDDKSGETQSTSITPEVIKALRACADRAEADIAQGLQPRIGSWGNRSDNPKAPKRKVKYLPPLPPRGQ